MAKHLSEVLPLLRRSLVVGLEFHVIAVERGPTCPHRFSCTYLLPSPHYAHPLLDGEMDGPTEARMAEGDSLQLFHDLVVYDEVSVDSMGELRRSVLQLPERTPVAVERPPDRYAMNSGALWIAPALLGATEDSAMDVVSRDVWLTFEVGESGTIDAALAVRMLDGEIESEADAASARQEIISERVALVRRISTMSRRLRGGTTLTTTHPRAATVTLTG